jgi:hypothetical protein
MMTSFSDPPIHALTFAHKSGHMTRQRTEPVLGSLGLTWNFEIPGGISKKGLWCPSYIGTTLNPGLSRTIFLSDCLSVQSPDVGRPAYLSEKCGSNGSSFFSFMKTLGQHLNFRLSTN